MAGLDDNTAHCDSKSKSPPSHYRLNSYEGFDTYKRTHTMSVKVVSITIKCPSVNAPLGLSMGQTASGRTGQGPARSHTEPRAFHAFVL